MSKRATAKRPATSGLQGVTSSMIGPRTIAPEEEPHMQPTTGDVSIEVQQAVLGTDSLDARASSSTSALSGGDN